MTLPLVDNSFRSKTKRSPFVPSCVNHFGGLVITIALELDSISGFAIAVPQLYIRANNTRFEYHFWRLYV